ncbi:MAG: SDR family NAD(P)-dependent oxidoreductase [Gammaproteobacteria bacterium]
MMPTFSSEFSVSLANSVDFARLSGDYNPLHVDAIAARRTQFGGTVTHGIHLMLTALDKVAATGRFDGKEPASLSATFNNPVLTGTPVGIRVTADAAGPKIRIVAAAAGRPAFTATLELQTSAAASAQPEDTAFESARPDEATFPPSAAEGSTPLRVSRRHLAALFPSLARSDTLWWIADLLASTHIVGMRCPGLDSIYSAFKFRHAAQTDEARRTSMRYAVDRADDRFRLVRMQVTGASLAGSIETFFRPRPVAQRSMAEVVAALPAMDCTAHRVLIIGGSRGLGELTAKIVAAAGAEVTITYARGKDDAERVCAEVRAQGRKCVAQALDVTSLAAESLPQWLTASGFTHVYFFASPQIAKNASARWNHALYEQFSRVYVAAFAVIVEQVLGARTNPDSPAHFLYPSSVFVEQAEPGFAEYAVAKASGEALCSQLHGRRGALFAKPRLPRMRTDQTSALVDIGAADPFPVMLDVVKGFHS